MLQTLVLILTISGPKIESDDFISVKAARKALRQLPDQMIERMIEATTRLDHDQLLRLFEEAEGYDRKLAQGLIRLADGYEYDRLMEIFNHGTK